MKRKFWWELIFVGVLLFLLAGAWSQRRQEVAIAAQAVLVPVIKPDAAMTAVGVPRILK